MASLVSEPIPLRRKPLTSVRYSSGIGRDIQKFVGCSKPLEQQRILNSLKPFINVEGFTYTSDAERRTARHQLLDLLGAMTKEFQAHAETRQQPFYTCLFRLLTKYEFDLVQMVGNSTVSELKRYDIDDVKAFVEFRTHLNSIIHVCLAIIEHKTLPRHVKKFVCQALALAFFRLPHLQAPIISVLSSCPPLSSEEQPESDDSDLSEDEDSRPTAIISPAALLASSDSAAHFDTSAAPFAARTTGVHKRFHPRPDDKLERSTDQDAHGVSLISDSMEPIQFSPSSPLQNVLSPLSSVAANDMDSFSDSSAACSSAADVISSCSQPGTRSAQSGSGAHTASTLISSASARVRSSSGRMKLEETWQNWNPDSPDRASRHGRLATDRLDSRAAGHQGTTEAGHTGENANSSHSWPMVKSRNTDAADVGAPVHAPPPLAVELNEMSNQPPASLSTSPAALPLSGPSSAQPFVRSSASTPSAPDPSTLLFHSNQSVSQQSPVTGHGEGPHTASSSSTSSHCDASVSHSPSSKSDSSASSSSPSSSSTPRHTSSLSSSSSSCPVSSCSACSSSPATAPPLSPPLATLATDPSLSSSSSYSSSSSSSSCSSHPSTSCSSLSTLSVSSSPDPLCPPLTTSAAYSLLSTSSVSSAASSISASVPVAPRPKSPASSSRQLPRSLISSPRPSSPHDVPALRIPSSHALSPAKGKGSRSPSRKNQASSACMAEPVLGLRSEIEVELGVDGPAQAQKTAQPATTPRKPATAASRHLTNMMHSLREELTAELERFVLDSESRAAAGQRFVRNNPSFFMWKLFADPLLDQSLVERAACFRVMRRPSFFCIFVGALCRHVFAFSHGDAEWHCLPGYWLMIQRTLVHIMTMLGDPFTPRVPVFSASKAALRNPMLLRMFAKACLRTTDAMDKHSINFSLNLLSQWFFCLEASAFQHPSSFTDYPELLKALTTLLSSDHFQVLCKALSFIYQFVNGLDRDHRRSVFEDLLLGTAFYPLFLHWCPEVRKYLHYILVFKICRGQSKHVTENDTKTKESKKPVVSPSLLDRVSSIMGELFAARKPDAKTPKKAKEALQDGDPPLDSCVMIKTVRGPEDVQDDDQLWARLQYNIRRVTDQIKDPSLCYFPRGLMPYAKPSVTGFIDTQALRERLQVVSHAASDSVMMPRLEFEIPRALGSEIDAVSPS